MNLIRTSRGSRIMSSVMALVFLFFTVNPSISYGLSSGPGQPELEAFTPIGMDNMVDVFSGDFSYNLPVLTVPGPDGGYPINLSYSAGPSMEQEASWVGLGWNLNPGVVNREVRGLPDDFNGQKVIKKLKQKPNRTFGAGIASKDIEILGADLQKILGGKLETSGNINLIYNNYKGFDVQAGVGFSLVSSEDAKAPQAASHKSILDQATGELLSGMSFADVIKKNFGADWKKNSFANLKHDVSGHFKNLAVKAKKDPFNTFSSIMSQSVCDVGYTHPMTSSSYTFNAKFGLDILGTTKDFQVEVYYKDQKVKEESVDVPAYGYLYSENNLSNSESGLMDFTLGNQSLITPDSRILSVPNFTNDVFHVKSHGINGSVRAYRGGISLLTDPTVNSDTKNIGGGAELNSAGASNKVGVNLNGGYVNAYSGPWKNGHESLAYLNNPLESKTATNQTFEPFHFKFSDEQTAEVNKGSVFGKESPYRLNLSRRMGLVTLEPKLLNTASGRAIKKIQANNSYREERERRAKNFTMLTESEAANFDGNYSRQVERVSGGGLIDVQYGSGLSSGDRMGAIHVTDEAGTNYIYGIPAKNIKTKDATFSVDANYGTGLASLIDKTTAYSATDNSTGNSKGQDQYYSSTETPEYAHSFLLTEILSEDYADLSDNGPSPEDFGSYVKFDYYIVEDFLTKTPISGANYLPGKLSNNGDDKATLSYYQKDLYYLKSIQTKTHIAVFELNTRSDARGILGENATVASGKNQYSLSKIKLYNLEDYQARGASARVIKTVNFEYSNSLCPGSYAGGIGKLTLDKIWYSISDTEKSKMSLSPYVFTYDSSKNFSYNQTNVDKWSSYQEAGANFFGSNVLYPYSTQQKDLADNFAGAWSLSRIKLPTGGEINISYESDDYRYVQDRQAMTMGKILGFAPSASAGYTAALDGNRYMIVRLQDSITSTQASGLVGGLEDIYFKAFMKMKGFGQQSLSPDGTPFSDGTTAYDLVEGYLDLQTTAVLYPSGVSESNLVALHVKSNGGIHPIKKAGWLELQTARTDLLDDSGISLSGLGNITSSMLGTIGNIISKAMTFLFNQNKFFIEAEAKGWCDELSTRGGMSSIVRLNSIHNKIGGGYRVKEITLNDSWGAMDGGSSESYGQRYTYELEQGISSGVAQYEPLTGGEENPFRKPVRYSTGGVPIRNNYLYAELPVGEAFFPAASVGYSKVTVSSIANAENPMSGTGIKMHEFYTAKDYPAYTDYTSIEKVNSDFSSKFIRFFGAKNFFQPGFSQGFYTELNDMHGKQKAVSTYSASADLSKSAPTEKIEYYYKTKGGYHPGKTNKLDNKVEVVFGEGNSSEEKIGITSDTYVHLRENHERTICGDLDGQIEYTIPFIVIPSAFPNIDYSYTMTRTAVTNNVINKSGILEKVIHTIDGAKTTTENLTYDYETGDPVVTAVNDLYGNRIYNYKQLAKWYYEEMGSAYQNIGIEIKGAVSNYADHLVAGDLLMNASGHKVWVTSNTGTAVTCRDAGGTLVSSVDGYRVMRSGYGNNLSAVTGSIQSTKNPTALNGLGLNLPLFDAFNNNKFQSTLAFEDCKTGQIYYSTDNDEPGDTSTVVTVNGNTLRWVLKMPLDLIHCLNSDEIAVIVPNVDAAYNLRDFNIHYVGNNKVKIVHPSGYSKQGDVVNLSGDFLPNEMADCFVRCLQNVLNASGSTYADNLKTKGDLSASLASAIDNNRYRYNFSGVYKPQESYYYDAQRTQAGRTSTAAIAHDYLTNINTDGEFRKFYWFTPAGDNPPQWKLGNEVTHYDPNGTAIEERNALGNYSAALFGYERSLPIAVAGNCKYEELAFDGFEEHGYTYDVTKQNNHINFGANVSLDSLVSHSGKYSMKVNSSVDITVDLDDHLELQSGKKYLLQVWREAGSTGYMGINDGSSTINAKVVSPNIEGWELIEIIFEAGAINDLLFSGLNSHFDDFRIMPFDANVKTFVYDKHTHKLSCQLDESNFGTFYNYDRDQVLVQIKKETERGIKTIQSTHRVTQQNL